MFNIWFKFKLWQTLRMWNWRQIDACTCLCEVHVYNMSLYPQGQHQEWRQKVKPLYVRRRNSQDRPIPGGVLYNAKRAALPASSSPACKLSILFEEYIYSDVILPYVGLHRTDVISRKCMKLQVGVCGCVRTERVMVKSFVMNNIVSLLTSLKQRASIVCSELRLLE